MSRSTDSKVLNENDVIMMRLFKLKPGSKSYKREENRIYIREFKHSILNEDQKQQQTKDLNQPIYVMPFNNFDESKTYFYNCSAFSETAEWINLP